MNEKLVVVLLVSIVLYSAYAGTGHRQRYGDVCNKSRKCDFTKWYRCKQMKCVCYNPPGKEEELYYDEAAKRCVGKAGTNCSQKFFPFDDEDQAIFLMRGTTTNHWRYGNGTLKCGANAFCDFDGKDHFCKCKKDFFAAADGTCAKLKAYGDPCKMDLECDPDVFLKCGDEGVCKCNGASRIYDTNLNRCVVTAGHVCETVKNKDDGHIVDDCPQDSFCEEGKPGFSVLCPKQVCRCGFGTQIHSDQTCQKGFGMECGPDHPCGDSKLSCRSKVCQCKYPLHMMYDEVSGQCVSLVSGPCLLNETSEFGIECTANAECVERNQITECACKPGFLRTDTGMCTKSFGSACETDNECNPTTGCVNNHCDCPDMLQHYDAKVRRCRSMLGARCEIGQEHTCIENGKCVSYDQGDPGKTGRCICKPGFKGTTNRTCDPMI